MSFIKDIFGGGGSTKIPKAPDPRELMRMQAQTNRINQTTPFGRLTFSGPDRNNLSMTMSPALQAQFAAQNRLGRRALNRADTALQRTSTAPITPQSTEQVQRALFDMGASRAMPIFNQQEAQMRERLEASGNPAYGTALSPGSVSEMDLFNRGRNQFLSDLALNSQIQATAQRGQLLGQDIGARQANMGTIQALAGLGPQSYPQLSNFYGPAAVDVMAPYNLQQQQGIAQSNINQQGNQGFMGGLFDLGAAAIGQWG
jgi:hypothetical protein